MFRVDEVLGWCAGVKVSGLSSVVEENWSLSEFLETVLEESQYEIGDVSVIVASVNEEETDQIAWLESNKFKKCPWFKNYIHEDRRTCLYMKQVPKKLYKKYFGK